MPLPTISEEDAKKALESVQSNLRWILDDNEVEQDVQVALYHVGFVKLRIFVGPGESRQEVRQALKESFGLDVAADLKTRQRVAMVLAACDGAKDYSAKETAVRVEAQTSRLPRPINAIEHLATRESYEKRFIKLRDSEVPSKHFLGKKTEDVEENDPKVERLQEVTSKEDGEEEYLTTDFDDSGVIKVRRGGRDGKLPTSPEELRAKHKLIGNPWLFMKSKHGNRPWLADLDTGDYPRLSDHVLGKHCYGLRVQGPDGSSQGPRWQLVSDYDYQVRKKAYEFVTNTNATISSALRGACASSEVKELYLVTPMALGARDGGRDRSRSGRRRSRDGPGGRKGAGKGRGRGRKGKSQGKGLALKSRTPDGISICYKFNNPSETCNGKCNMAHVCQVCCGKGHGYTECPKLKDGGGGKNETDDPNATHRGASNGSTRPPASNDCPGLAPPLEQARPQESMPTEDPSSSCPASTAPLTRAVVQRKADSMMRVLYLYAGERRRADIRAHLTMLSSQHHFKLHMIEKDLLQHGATDDLADDSAWEPLIASITIGEWDIVMATPPCNDHSRARWAITRSPKPHRSRQYVRGFPWLSGHALEKCQFSNLLIDRILLALRAAHFSPARSAILTEHPEDLGRTKDGADPASIWQLHEVRELAKDRCRDSGNLPLPLARRTVSQAHAPDGHPDEPRLSRLRGLSMPHAQFQLLGPAPPCLWPSSSTIDRRQRLRIIPHLGSSSVPTRYVRGHRAAHGADLSSSLQHALSRWGASAFGCTEPTFSSEVVFISGYFGLLFFNFTGGRPS